MGLNKDWISGFVDGEGCFYISFVYNKSSNRFVVRFQLLITQKEKKILEDIQKYLSCGRVFKHGTGFVLNIRKQNEIKDIIIPLFEKHPLNTKKHSDFLIWKKCFLKFIGRDNYSYDENLIKELAECREKMNTFGKHLKRDSSDISILQRSSLKPGNEKRKTWQPIFQN